jgi:hypothetical protein
MTEPEWAPAPEVEDFTDELGDEALDRQQGGLARCFPPPPSRIDRP